MLALAWKEKSIILISQALAKGSNPSDHRLWHQNSDLYVRDPLGPFPCYTESLITKGGCRLKRDKRPQVRVTCVKLTSANQDLMSNLTAVSGSPRNVTFKQ